VANDIDTISNTLQQSITQFITAIVTLVGIVVMMLTISPLLTLVAIISLPLSFLVTKVIARQSQKYFAQQQKYLGQLNGHVEEMYTGHKIVKAFNYEKQSIDKFNKVNDQLYNAGWKAQFISGIIMPLMSTIGNLGYVFIAILGGISVAKGTMTIGNVQAFIQYSRQFTQPIVQTANIANIIQSTIAAAERVFEVLDEPEQLPDKKEAIHLDKPQGNIKLEHVKFGYSSEKIFIKDMNMNIKKGQTIAIVGPTGAGKTTLVNLLMRFYEIDDGRITFDGIDIRDMKRGELRSLFGMVLQDTWLFKGTIKENIAYGRLGAADQDIEAVRAGVTLADGFRTAPAKIRLVRSDRDLSKYSITIHEGHKREIREILRVFNKQVSTLVRVAIGTLGISLVPNPGDIKRLSKREIESLKKRAQKRSPGKDNKRL